MIDLENPLCNIKVGNSFLRMFVTDTFVSALVQINVVGSSTLDVLEKPELLSPKVVQAALTDQMHKFVSSVKNAELVLMAPGRNSKRESTSGTSDLPA